MALLVYCDGKYEHQPLSSCTTTTTTTTTTTAAGAAVTDALLLLLLLLHLACNTDVITVIQGATVTISKSLGQYLSNITGKYGVKSLHKRAILGTAQILREVLMSMCRTFNMGNNITCNIDCKQQNSCNTL